MRFLASPAGTLSRPMIPLLPLLLAQTFRPQDHSGFFEEPAWVQQALRDAPPSPPSVHYPAPTRDAKGRLVMPPGTIILDKNAKGVTLPPDAPPNPWDAMNRRARAALERGDYEAAYREEDAGHDAFEMVFSSDLLTDAALLSGRRSQAEALLVQHFRIHPGGMTPCEVQLSLALALRGKVYPGQADYVRDEMRRKASPHPDEARLVEGSVGTGDAPRDVVFLSALALGYAWQNIPYLEWALRLNPRSELAGSRLTEFYEDRRRYADAARVAASMVAALPASLARDGFALRLKALRREAAPTPAKGG